MQNTMANTKERKPRAVKRNMGRSISGDSRTAETAHPPKLNNTKFMKASCRPHAAD
jgi:hypothetical protein